MPTLVTAHTFCASRDSRVPCGWCLLTQGYFYAVENYAEKAVSKFTANLVPGVFAAIKMAVQRDPGTRCKNSPRSSSIMSRDTFGWTFATLRYSFSVERISDFSKCFFGLFVWSLVVFVVVFVVVLVDLGRDRGEEVQKWLIRVQSDTCL